MNPIAITQLPTGNVSTSDADARTESSDDSSDSDFASAEAASFSALLLQQSSPSSPSSATEAPLAASPDRLNVTPESTSSNDTSQVKPDLNTLPQLSVEGESHLSGSLQSSGSPADSSVAVVGQTNIATDTSAQSPSLGTDGRVEEHNEGASATDLSELVLDDIQLTEQQLDDPDADSAESIDELADIEAEQVFAAERASLVERVAGRPASLTTQAFDPALSPFGRPAENRMKKRVDDGPDEPGAPAPASSVAHQATSTDSGAALAIDGASVEGPTDANKLQVTNSVPGLQKIVNELVAESATVVDEKTISVRFEEPHIGSVLIQMSETDDGLTVSVAADDDLTLEMLSSNSQQLESTLKDNDIELVEITRMDADSATSGEQARDQDLPQPAADHYRNSVHRESTSSATDSPRQAAADVLSFRA